MDLPEIGCGLEERNDRGLNERVRLRAKEKESVAGNPNECVYATRHCSCAPERLGVNVPICVCRKSRHVDAHASFRAHELRKN